MQELWHVQKVKSKNKTKQMKKKKKKRNQPNNNKKRHSQQCGELEIEFYRTVLNWQLQSRQLPSNSASQILGLSNLWQTHHFPCRPLPLTNLLTPGNGVWERHVLCLECQLVQIVGWNASSWHQSSSIPCSAMLALPFWPLYLFPRQIICTEIGPSL